MQHSNQNEMDEELILKLLKQQHPDQKYSPDASKAITELVRLFVTEARERAGKDAHEDLDDIELNERLETVSISAENIMKIASELLMDFS